MPDLEKVISELFKFREEMRTCNNTTYVSAAKKMRRMDLIDKTISLLKAQEPVEPKHEDDRPISPLRCGNCGAFILVTNCYKAKYCFHCGRVVKWE